MLPTRRHVWSKKGFDLVVNNSFAEAPNLDEDLAQMPDVQSNLNQTSVRLRTGSFKDQVDAFLLAPRPPA